MLLALAEQQAVSLLLHEVGIADALALVDARYPCTRAPLEPAGVEPDGLAAMAGSPPNPGPIPPLFERFSEQALAAVERGVECARELESPRVEAAHLLLGLLRTREGVLADAHARHERELRAAASRVVEILSDGPRERPTDIFSDAARAIVAEGALEVAQRLRAHACLSSGHLLLAALESDDAQIAAAVATVPIRAALAAELSDALPGSERMSL